MLEMILGLVARTASRTQYCAGLFVCHKSMLMMSYLLCKGCTIAAQLTAHLMLESTQLRVPAIFIIFATLQKCIALLNYAGPIQSECQITAPHCTALCPVLEWCSARRVMTQWPSRSLSREAQHAVDCLQTFQVWKYLSLLADKQQ